MKNSLFIFAASFVLVAISCQKAEFSQPEVKQNRILTVTANIAQFNAESKTSIDGAATTIRPVWSSGDKIKLFNTDGNSAVYVVNTGAGTSYATFNLDNGQSALEGTFACAYYPADSARTYSAGTGITAGIPSSQTYTANGTGANAGTFAINSFPMVGYGTLDTGSTNMNLTFKNLFGLVQINLKDESETVSRIDIVGASALSGTAIVTPQASVEGTPTCTVSGNKYVTLVASTPVALSSTASTAFYIAVPTCTLSRIYVTSSSKLIMKKTSSTIVRSQIRSMPDLTISNQTAVTYSEYPDAKPVVVAGILWAPVNCGYEPASGDNKGYTYGKMYQWGRKYGHGYKGTSGLEDNDYPGKSGGSQPIDTIKNENDQLASHPDVTFNGTFYSISSVEVGFTSMNWYKGSESVSATAPAPNKLWNSNEGTSDPVSKSDFDPCPQGWRVPTKIEMETLLNATIFTNVDSGNHGSSSVKGSKFVGNDGDDDNFVFLPLSGYLEAGGKSSLRGTKPYYWSSSVDNKSSYYLTATGKFSPQKYVVDKDEKRVLGCSVRCVKE